MSKRPTLILLGPAGSGKGTQADFLEEHLGYYKVETGEIIREKSKEQSLVGIKIKKINDSGEHLSDDLARDLISVHIKNVPVRIPLLIDGFPRTIGQAKMLDTLLKESGRNPMDLIVFWINVSKQECERRLMNRSQCLKCRMIFKSRIISVCPECEGVVQVRDNDYPQAISKRLGFFEAEVMGAIKYFEIRKLLVIINGENQVLHVFDQIKNAINKHVENNNNHNEYGNN